MTRRLLPLEPIPQPWSGAEARRDLRAYATRHGRVSWRRYAKGFIYSAPGADTEAGFKLPVANVYRTADGRMVLRANRRAIESAAGVLDGARGGVDIPRRAHEEARELVGRYYDKMGRQPPWPPRGPGTPDRPNPLTLRLGPVHLSTPNPDQMALFNGPEGPEPEWDLPVLTWSPKDAGKRRVVRELKVRLTPRAAEQLGWNPVVGWVAPSSAARRSQYGRTHGRLPDRDLTWFAIGPRAPGVAKRDSPMSGHKSAELASDALEQRARAVLVDYEGWPRIAASPEPEDVPGLTPADELEPPQPERLPTDLPPTKGDGQPAVLWVWQPPRAGGAVLMLGGVSRSTEFKGRLDAVADRMAARLVRHGGFHAEAAGPDTLGGSGGLIVITAENAASRKRLAKVAPDKLADDFTEVWTELFGASALDAYRDTHWGDEPSSVELVDPSELAPTGALVGLGELVEATYETTKGGGDVTHYVHKFGEEGGPRPLLAFDGRQRLYVIGGTYTVTTLGIEG